MSLLIGDTTPNFTANTTKGEIDFHEYIGDSWCVLFSHPASFTPVCTTELGQAANLELEFKKRNVKISKNVFYKMGKDIVYYYGVKEWFTNINNYIKNLSKK